MNRKLSTSKIYLAPVALTMLLFIWASYKSLELKRAANNYQEFIRILPQNPFEASLKINQAVALSQDNAFYLSNQALIKTWLMRKRIQPKQLLEGEIKVDLKEASYIEEAIGIYLKAIALNPNDDGIYHNLGWLYYFAGNREKGFECFRKAVSLDNKITLYYVSLGLLHERNGEKEEADKQYALAINTSPGILDSKFFVDFHKRSPERAEKVVAEVVLDLESQRQKESTSFLKAKLGKLYFYKGSFEEAENLLKEVIASDQGFSRPWLTLGLIYEQKGLEEEAKQYYEKAAFLEAGEPLPFVRLGDLYYRRNQIATAMTYYTRGISNLLEQSSMRSRKSIWLYNSKVNIPNDVVPYDLLYYCIPTFNIQETCLKVAKFYKQSGNENLAKHFENLGKRFTPES